jgi:hypothetical protein
MSVVRTETRRVLSVSIITVAAFLAISCMTGAVLAGSEGTGLHTLKATTSGQGDISPSGDIQVSEGAGRSFVFDSDENHRLVDLIVDGTSIGPVAAFSFENVDASHTIEAVFEASESLRAKSEISL